MAANDYFDAADADGRIRLGIDGTDYILKRPKIKEFRVLRERLLEIAQQAQATTPDDGSGDETPGMRVGSRKIDPHALAANEDALLDWWENDLFAMLEEQGRAFPRDDAPVWLLGPQIVPEMMQAWLNRPARPGA